MTDENSADLEALARLAERFAANELAPGLLERDDYPCAPFRWETVRKAGEVGLLSLMLPEEIGGTGQGMSALCRVLESLAAVDAGFAAVVLVNALAQRALVLWGRPSHLDGMPPSSLIAFPAYAAPRDLPWSIASEEVAGGFRLDGSLDYQALAPVADRLILPARPEGGGRTALYVVDRSSQGVVVKDPVLSLGLRPCPVADVELADVFVPETDRLCEDAGGVYPGLAAAFRPAVAALSLGVLRGSLKTAADYAQQRHQGGRMIVEHDQVRLMLADMAVALETGRELVRAMADRVDRGDAGLLAHAGLALVSEQACHASSDGVQVLGGYGYTKDYGQEKRMRDARQIASFFGGAMMGRLELIDAVLGKEG